MSSRFNEVLELDTVITVTTVSSMRLDVAWKLR